MEPNNKREISGSCGKEGTAVTLLVRRITPVEKRSIPSKDWLSIKFSDQDLELMEAGITNVDG